MRNVKRIFVLLLFIVMVTSIQAQTSPVDRAWDMEPKQIFGWTLATTAFVIFAMGSVFALILNKLLNHALKSRNDATGETNALLTDIKKELGEQKTAFTEVKKEVHAMRKDLDEVKADVHILKNPK